MAATASDRAKPVALLRFCSTRPGSTKKWMNIHAREQSDIGRSDVKHFLGTEALTISTHHLRLRCVVYEDDDEHCVAPMVYFRVLSFNSVELIRRGAGHNTGVTISRGHGDILLSNGDVLKLTPEIFLQFQYHTHIELHNALDDLQRAEAECFANQFALSGRRLGVGGHGCVYIAVKQSSKRQFACKTLPLPETDESFHDNHDRDLRMTAAQREAKLLKERKDKAREYVVLAKLNHPNVVSLEKVICATYNIYIFQELITGGDLSSYLDQNNGPLVEPEAAAITFQLLKAVDYLHSSGFVHRDIKPENILMTSWREGARVVLTDFGQARAIDNANAAHNNAKVFRMQSLVGTYGYTAPEIFQQVKQSLPRKGYSKAVDIWSIGCVTAAMLTGETIFPQDEHDFPNAKHPPSESTYRERWDVNIIDDQESWTEISRKAKQFVKGCLAMDETDRLSAKQALSEEWFTNKHYATELTAAYERAVADWQPRKQNGSLIDFIDTTDADSITPQRGPSAPDAIQYKSKHFQGAQKPVILPPPAMKKTTLVAKPQLPPQPPMSRDAREGSRAMALPIQHATNDFTFASPLKPGDSMPFSDYTANGSAGPLSIWKYAPPQIQFTVQPQQLMRQQDSATQSQSMLDAPTQTQPTRPANMAGFCYGERVVDSQETQSQADKPRKKICR